MAAFLRELVLGGDGLIGRELCQQLLSAGHHVTSLDIKTGNDLREIGNTPYLASDRVWFLAWDTGGAKYHSAVDKQHEIYTNNCQLSVRVFDALATTRKPFLFVSSQLAGQPSAYGLTKLMAEYWAQQLGGRVARLWNTYGWESPDKKSHVVTDLVLSGLQTDSVKMMTTGKERRRFIYKSDSVRLLKQFFDSDLKSIDIAGERWISILELATEVAKQLNRPLTSGDLIGEEVILDPVNTISSVKPNVSLEMGVKYVINEARDYLAGFKNATNLLKK